MGSPDGDDSNSGARDAPLESVQLAIDTILVTELVSGDIDTVTGVEFLQFDDATLDTALIA